MAYSGAGTTEVYNVAYDALNRPTQQQYTAPGACGGVFRLDTTYTTAGQRATLRYPGGNGGQQGESVTFGYNAVGQLNSVTSDDGTQYVASTAYNAQGQVTEQRLDSGANGFTRQYSYNANGRGRAVNDAASTTGVPGVAALAGPNTAVCGYENSRCDRQTGLDWPPIVHRGT